MYCCSFLGISIKIVLGIRTSLSDSIMWMEYHSCVWGMIFQRGSTLKLSIAFPVASRHCHNKTKMVESDRKPKKKKLSTLSSSSSEMDSFRF